MSRDFRFSGQISQRVYRRLGERYSDACVREVDRFGGVGGGGGGGRGVRNGLRWDFSWGENAPSGYSG